jgi:hypothetical protein
LSENQGINTQAVRKYEHEGKGMRSMPHGIAPVAATAIKAGKRFAKRKEAG